MPKPKPISSAANPAFNIRRLRQPTKLVVILGATGAGKSRLSVELASRFSGEIINSDKIQLYRGLDITTNKIPISERSGVPHHLLGDFDSSSGDLSPSDYTHHADSAIAAIRSRRHTPFLVGGSNSLIHAVLSGSDSDPFDASDPVCPSSSLRYRCCFLWVDVATPVLNEYLDKRVDEMFDSGMLDELADFFSGQINDSEPNSGIRKAIGVPELEPYFKILPAVEGNDEARRDAYEDAVRAIKENTCRLANRQAQKITRLKSAGWDLRRVDATDAFKGVLDGDQAWRSQWEAQVLHPSINIVKRFLEDE